jgi:hypothetical protein
MSHYKEPEESDVYETRVAIPDAAHEARMAVVEAARDYTRNYGGDNDADRARWKVLVAALAKVPE